MNSESASPWETSEKVHSSPRVRFSSQSRKCAISHAESDEGESFFHGRFLCVSLKSMSFTRSGGKSWSCWRTSAGID